MKIKVKVSTRKIGSTVENIIEIDDEDLEGLSEEDRDEFIESESREAMFEMIEWNWEVDED